MARSRREGIYVPQPRTDVYVWMMIVTFFMTLIATVLLYLEYKSIS